MAPRSVEGDYQWFKDHYHVDRKMTEIKRQLHQAEGYPYDLTDLMNHLQGAVEGRFLGSMLPVNYVADGSQREHFPGLISEPSAFRQLVWISMARVKLAQVDNVTAEEVVWAFSRNPHQVPLDVWVRDSLLRLQDWIPKSWNGFEVYFADTVLRGTADGKSYIAGIKKSGRSWRGTYKGLDCKTLSRERYSYLDTRAEGAI